MSENAFEKWTLGGKQDLNIADAASYARGVMDELIRGSRAWYYSDVQRAFEKKFGTSELSLTGLAKVVKGEKFSIGVTSEQFDAIKAIYKIDDVDAIMSTINATVSIISGEKTETGRLIWLHAHNPTGEIIISEGLARKLGISGKDEEIKILNVEEDVNGLNLDKYLR